jgi:conjugative transfer region protein TrbK
MRLRPEHSIVMRLVLVATLVIAAVSLIVAFHALDADRQTVPGLAFPGFVTGDAELIRCRDLGMAAAQDVACLAAWSDEQRRFFGTSQTPPSVPSALPHASGTEEEAVDTQAGELEVQSE